MGALSIAAAGLGLVAAGIVTAQTGSEIGATDMRDAAQIVIGARAAQLAGPTGHVVVRVEKGGERYRVFVLDNRNERDTIVAAKGPLPAS